MMLRRLRLTLALVLACAGTVRATHAWQNDDMGKRINITVPSPDGDLSAHPFAIILDGLGITDTDIVEGEWCIYDHNDNLLDWEQEAYAEAAGTCTGAIWTVVDQYSAPAGEQNHVFFYYNKVSGATPGNTPADVWDANYIVVMHLSDATPFADSTGSGHTGADNNTGQSTGAVANGREWNASTDKVTIADHADLDGFDDLTVEIWANAGTIGSGTAYGRFFGKSQSSWGYAYEMNFEGGNDGLTLWVNNDILTATNVTPGSLLGAWHHVAGVYERNTVNGKIIYVDGVNEAAENAADVAVNADTADLLLGNSPAVRGFDGDLDEFRLSNTARSADWLKQCFTVSDTGLTYAAIESKPAGGIPSHLRMRSPHLDGGHIQ